MSSKPPQRSALRSALARGRENASSLSLRATALSVFVGSLLSSSLLTGCEPGGEVQRTSPESLPASALPPAGGSADPPVASDGGEAGGDESVTDSSGTSEGTSGDTSGSSGTSGDTAGIEEELEPVAPETYGKVYFPVEAPPAEELTVHGLAGYEVVAIYSRPDMTSDKLGYLRIGTRMMVTPKIEDPTKACKKGFHGLPMGGYVCASKGWVVDAEKPPYMQEPPGARLDEALPYDYGYVRRWNSPMWWRIPTLEELKAATLHRAIREAERVGAPPPGSDAGAGDGDGGGDGAAEVPAAEAVSDAEPDTEEADLLAMKLPLSPGSPWLERGNFLSLGTKTKKNGRSFYRTARGAFVNTSSISRYEAKDYQGIAIDDEVAFPVAFVSKKTTRLLRLDENDKLKGVRGLERRDFVDVNEETEINGRAYMITAEGFLVRKEHLNIPELQPLPKGLEPWERWIDVNLKTQTLVAYEGTRPVYVTLVSTGKKGSKEEPFDTPTGRWRIYSKHISSTMDGNT
ncbi:MAG TPA: murein L,D-transpeptidase, partial [Nannocystis exedens]|nr:murein L,D-transpeptidase [Nannocystis exedens]